MSLKEYNKKRNFNKTSEPVGKVEKNNKALRFVIQHHIASSDHYDLRLEYNGVLLSWAVPKGLSKNPKIKRLAIMVEDHPISYINFEGVIPKGNYGAGAVDIFDQGIFEPLNDFKKGLDYGQLKFSLYGKKLKGTWSLIRTNNNNWIIVKARDEFASKTNNFLVKKNNPFNNCTVQLATLSSIIPKGKNWFFEIKYDGYRMLSFIQGETVKLVSRNGINFSSKFTEICKSLASIAKTIPMVLDGEIVCFDKNGRSDFGLLQSHLKSGHQDFFYVIFDTLAYNGKDLRGLSLAERKDYLNKILTNCPPNIIYSNHIVGNGTRCFNYAKKMNLEGIIAKNSTSTYSGKRTDDWLKIKCYKRQEFVIVGFTTTNKNKLLSAILVGYYKKNKLLFAGKVGTGFNEKSKQDLSSIFSKYKIEKCPLYNPSTIIDCVWLRPKLVAEIQFSEITKSGILRQPSFISLRLDKDAKDIVLEYEYDDK